MTTQNSDTDTTASEKGVVKPQNTERYPHLKYMLADYIKELCQQHFLDLAILKTKEDRIAALQLIPNLRDITATKAKDQSSQSSFQKCKLHGFHQLGSEDDL